MRTTQEIITEIVGQTDYDDEDLAFSPVIMNPEDFKPYRYLLLKGRILPVRFDPEVAQDEYALTKSTERIKRFAEDVVWLLRNRSLDISVLRKFELSQAAPGIPPVFDLGS